MAADKDESHRSELLQIEEADAWFEYRDVTSPKKGQEYIEVEPWAWDRLQERLRLIVQRRSKLELTPGEAV